MFLSQGSREDKSGLIQIRNKWKHIKNIKKENK